MGGPARVLLTVAVACTICLSQSGCGSRPAIYQVTRSDDGRCVCEVIEYDDPKGDAPHRLLDLRILLDGREVLGRSYLGGKGWGGKGRHFAVGRVGPFYYLSVAGHPGYALAATDGGTGSVWFQATDEPSKYIHTAFSADPAIPRLTDLKWVNTFILTPDL